MSNIGLTELVAWMEAEEERMAATPKSPAERAREEKKKAEAARTTTSILEAARGGGKTIDWSASSIGTGMFWYDEIDRHLPSPGLPPAHPPAWLNGFVNRLTAIDRALAALSDRLDLIDSTVLNIQQEIRRDRS